MVICFEFGSLIFLRALDMNLKNHGSGGSVLVTFRGERACDLFIIIGFNLLEIFQN